MFFCHEWVQVTDEEICAVRLKNDLRSAEGKPILLFNASDAPWAYLIHAGVPEGSDLEYDLLFYPSAFTNIQAHGRYAAF